MYFIILKEICIRRIQRLWLKYKQHTACIGRHPYAYIHAQAQSLQKMHRLPSTNKRQTNRISTSGLPFSLPTVCFEQLIILQAENARQPLLHPDILLWSEWTCENLFLQVSQGSLGVTQSGWKAWYGTHGTQSIGVRAWPAYFWATSRHSGSYSSRGGRLLPLWPLLRVHIHTQTLTHTHTHISVACGDFWVKASWWDPPFTFLEGDLDSVHAIALHCYSRSACIWLSLLVWIMHILLPKQR